jgi:hypothetical protein
MLIVDPMTMNPSQVTPVEPGNRIQLPAEWAESLGLRGRVTLDRIADGIVVRPCAPASWDEIFATKLVAGSAPRDENPDVMEADKDDFLF